MDTTTKISLVAERRHIAYLDRLCADTRESTGAVIHRSQIIGLLIDSLAKRGVNASKIRTEDDLRRQVA